MNREISWWLIAAAGTLIAGAAIGTGASWAPNILIAALFFIAVTFIGIRMAWPTDRSWLPSLVMVALVLKLAGSWVRFYFVTVVYRSGDAYGYHEIGVELAHQWRSLLIPTSESTSSAGTYFTEVLTGIIYIPYVPDMLGGFFIFAFLAFIGQLLFYSAFRLSAPTRFHKRYGLAILFLPTFLFWPSSIGKDALMVLFIGAASYGAARLFQRYSIGPIVLIGAATALAAGIRAHMGLLIVASLVMGMVIARSTPTQGGRVVRFVVLIVVTAGLALALMGAADRFNIGGDGKDVGTFVDSVTERTDTGGSAVDAGPVSSPLDIPEAFLRVFFQPLLWEAWDLSSLLSAIEGTILLVIILWRLPTVVRNLKYARRLPYLVYSGVYTFGFAIGFSAVVNLGILARQRSQGLPMFVALIAGMGWALTQRDVDPSAPEPEDELEAVR